MRKFMGLEIPPKSKKVRSEDYSLFQARDCALSECLSMRCDMCLFDLRNLEEYGVWYDEQQGGSHNEG